jgi:TPR repeat protein
MTGWLKRWRHVTAQEPLESLVESLFVLGENYEAGDWVRQSDLLAYMWYLLAATAGHDSADPARHRMATRLSPAEIAAAQALARQCHASDYWHCGEASAAEDLALEHLATGTLARSDADITVTTTGGGSVLP